MSREFSWLATLLCLVRSLPGAKCGTDAAKLTDRPASLPVCLLDCLVCLLASLGLCVWYMSMCVCVCHATHVCRGFQWSMSQSSKGVEEELSESNQPNRVPNGNRLSVILLCAARQVLLLGGLSLLCIVSVKKSGTTRKSPAHIIHVCALLGLLG